MIISDNEMVDVDSRKLIPVKHIIMRMSDDGVGFEGYYHEEVRESVFRLNYTNVTCFKN